MAKPAAPSRRTRRVDVRGWLGGVRFSGFVVILLGLVVLGAFVLVPSIGDAIAMRQQIEQAQVAVKVSQNEIADLERERDRWDDPAFIQSQARERLYFTNPGEVTYLIQDDIDHDELPDEPEPVSPDLTERDRDWKGTILRSVVEAGLAQQVVVDEGEDDVFAPTESPDATDAPDEGEQSVSDEPDGNE